MKKYLIFLFMLLVSCQQETEQTKIIYVKEEYKVYGDSNFMRIYVFEINNHEYLGSPYSDYFIHSPNCKCQK